MTAITVFVARQGPRPRHITPGAFRDRFTATEAARIELASLDNPAASEGARLVAAGLRAQQKRLDGAEYVDLDDAARTRAPVVSLEAAGLLDAPGRALQILDDPVLDAERPGN